MLPATTSTHYIHILWQHFYRLTQVIWLADPSVVGIITVTNRYIPTCTVQYLQECDAWWDLPRLRVRAAAVWRYYGNVMSSQYHPSYSYMLNVEPSGVNSLHNIYTFKLIYLQFRAQTFWQHKWQSKTTSSRNFSSILLNAESYINRANVTGLTDERRDQRPN